ncbi:MAG: Holliday junction branch migration protein RuvA [Clostridia bacterium]|jgi:Holliday junction DNA helicase RuvA|nr:Holliday junction branch migration protein RuvA [Clostridia bacterium]NLV35000.1 Holliday junction branch migration protein RuvA [Clostridiaceae bacterium]HQM95971.1 Holliday junction branch migration protein RuvA [Clostridia bacterium]HQO69086.1 Holliday junction branch migration protein RuvA [Clostridia bacterium]
MYEYIKGEIVSKKHDYVVVDNAGIGYKIFTSINTMSRLQTNEQALLHTYLHVREDIMVLYGFYSEEELFLFNMLISISGIGPKAALSILSVLSYQEVATAVVCEDAASLSKAPGIGKKTAMRIILELKDKLKGLDVEDMEVKEQIEVSDKYSEAVNALLVLGYNTKYAREALNKTYNEKDSLQDIIKKALAG